MSDARTIKVPDLLTGIDTPPVLLGGLCVTEGHPRDLFFPDTNGNSKASKTAEAKAKAVCVRCPVRDACYQHAYTNREHGIWGGTTDEDRRRARTTTTTGRHGYPGGRDRHLRRDEAPCDACQAAWIEYRKENEALNKAKRKASA